MTSLLKKHFREVETTREKIVSILVFGMFIFLFLFVFKPFGIADIKVVKQFFISLGYGFVTIFVLFIFRFLFEPHFNKDIWTLGKSILWDLVIVAAIGTANYFYVSVIFTQGFVFKYLLFSLWTTLLVGSIPVTLSYVIAYNRMYKTALQEAAVPIEDVLWESEVTLRAGNPKNEFKTNPKNIVYLCSNDNYVTIVTMKGDVQNKSTIRGTLKSAESELRKNNRFIRCHKCFIVNLDFVDKVTGHNQNMKIKLLSSGIEIPVSRSKAEVVARRTKKQ
ncbi:MAG TPA: LytTR family DNA-binding domain-containing protein [Bacteroidales bacterium]|nr:LytTR family DNA-binding domain-containing protein [Bacteroidales bacterium]